MYSLLLAIIYLAFISLGLPDSLIGAGWPAMHSDLGVPLSYAGLITVVIAGLGSAPIYPAIIHSTPRNFGAKNSQAIIGIQMASAYTGSTLAPPLFGFLSAVTGMWILPLFMGALVVLGLVMSERLNKVA